MRLTSSISYQTLVADRGSNGPGEAETAAAVREANGGNSTADQRRTGEQAAGDTLTAQEQAVVAKLLARDAEGEAQEAAHAAAGGRLAGAASYSDQQHMRQGRSGAVAPARPSGADRAVAAAARAREAGAEVAADAEEARGAMGSDHHHHDGSVCPLCAQKVDRYAANLPPTEDSGDPSAG